MKFAKTSRSWWNGNLSLSPLPLPLTHRHKHDLTSGDANSIFVSDSRVSDIHWILTLDSI
jgi:hypothetical protein